MCTVEEGEVGDKTLAESGGISVCVSSPLNTEKVIKELSFQHLGARATTYHSHVMMWSRMRDMTSRKQSGSNWRWPDQAARKKHVRMVRTAHI